MEQTRSIVFERLFDIKELQKLQDQFADAFGVASVITTPEGEYLTKPSNFSYLCQNIIRCTEKGATNCMHSDALIGRHNPDGPIVQPCLSGILWDAGASITMNGQHIANWLIGQVRIKGQEEGKVLLYAREIGADESEFARAFSEIPVTTEEQFRKIANLLFTIANQLSEKAYQNFRQAKLIEEKTQANEALFESEAKFRNLFERSPLGKSITELDGTMRVNKAFCSLLGYSIEELNEIKFEQVSHPDDVAMSIDVAHSMLEGSRDQVKFEKRYIHKNGSIVWADVSTTLQRDKNGKPQYFITVINDLTDRKNAEKALSESEERYHAFINADTDMIFVKDENLRYILANVATANFFGKNKEELIGKTDLELSDSRIIRPCISSDQKALGSDSAFVIEEKLGDRVFEVTKFPLMLKDDKKGIGGIMRDITNRKANEEAIRNEKNLLRTVIDNLPVSIYVKDVECRKIVSNKMDAEKLGFSSEAEVLGKTDLELFNNLDGFQSYNDDLMVVNYGKVIINREESFPNIDGSRRWTLTTKIPLTDQFGKIIGLVGIGRDITEQRQANETILKLSKGIEQNPATIVITDLNGNIEYVNPKFLEVTGYTQEEAIGQNPRILKSGEMNPESYKNLWQTITSGGVWRGELHNRKKNGELFWESATITSIKNEKGVITNYIAIKEDITVRKRMEAELIVAKEKAEESDRLKSAFLANMSHEIRTPLNSIIGFSELLNDPDFDEDQKKEFISYIIGNGNHLLNIISDIVDLSKIEAGEIVFRKSKIQAKRLISEIESLFRLKAEQKGLEFRVEQPANSEDVYLEADKDRLMQIFNNLLINALKFTSEGCIEVGCRILKSNVEFSVKDSGIGISSKHHTKIFDRFRQVESSFNRKYGGNGLGLSITKNLVELMGGRIWLESEVDKGSTFYFTVPLKK